jgi:hypothetical protein
MFMVQPSPADWMLSCIRRPKSHAGANNRRTRHSLPMLSFVPLQRMLALCNRCRKERVIDGIELKSAIRRTVDNTKEETQ